MKRNKKYQFPYFLILIILIFTILFGGIFVFLKNQKKSFPKETKNSDIIIPTQVISPSTSKQDNMKIINTSSKQSIVKIPLDAVKGSGTFEVSEGSGPGGNYPLGLLSQGPELEIQVLQWNQIFEFQKPFIIEMTYEELKHFDEDKLVIAYYDEKSTNWTPLKSSVNKANKIVTTEDANKLGYYRLFGPLTCLRDENEPYDDNYSLYKNPVISDFKNVYSRLFDIKDDVDWITFPIKKGKIYTVKIINPTQGAAVYMSYSDGLIDDKTEIPTKIEISQKADYDGQFWVYFKPTKNSITGCSANYQFQITEN